MILEPNNPSSLDFSLNNPSDQATYYVQAMVRATVSNTVIGMYKLSLVTGQYYRAPWTTPVDASGVGFQIVILFSVYTDAGYTQLSPVYGTTMVAYTIRHLASQNLGGFTRGSDVDYKKLEKMVQKAVDGIKFPEEDQSNMQVGFGAIMKLLDAMPGKLSAEIKKVMQTMQAMSEARHAEMKKHVSKEIGDTGSEIAQHVRTHEGNSATRHIEAVGATNDVADKLGDIDEKIPEPQEDVPGILPPTQAVQQVGKKVDDLKGMLEKHHQESIKEIRKPVNLNLGTRTPEANNDEPPEKKTANKASELVALSGAPQA